APAAPEADRNHGQGRTAAIELSRRHQASAGALQRNRRRLLEWLEESRGRSMILNLTRGNPFHRGGFLRKLGAAIIFQNYFRAPKPDWQLYEEDLALAEMVERLGFDSLWGVEHHFSPYTMPPDVLSSSPTGGIRSKWRSAA